MKIKVKINKILRITAGKFHCWCDSNVGVIKKENNKVPEFLWNTFFGKEPLEELTKEDKESLAKFREEASKILDIDKNKLVSGFWLNSMQPGDVTTAHTHDDDDELLSCVYYIKVPKDEQKSGDLVIIENNEKTVLKPKEGYFVFFSPATLHEVTKNESDDARPSIAFNFGLVRT